jgi:hypothetical protein
MKVIRVALDKSSAAAAGRERKDLLAARPPKEFLRLAGEAGLSDIDRPPLWRSV